MSKHNVYEQLSSEFYNSYIAPRSTNKVQDEAEQVRQSKDLVENKDA